MQNERKLYPWLKFHQVFLHFTARLWSIPGSNFTKFPCILQPDCGVSLAQISLSFLYFTARLWSILGSNPTKFSCILQPDSGVSSARQSIQSIDTPRGSWASFDLRNSVSDQLIPSLLERVAPETIDQLNEVRRQEERQV
jgi:hypothetical protein